MVSDSFNRANSSTLGTTEVGSKTWVQQHRDAGGTFVNGSSLATPISSNKVVINTLSAANVQIMAFVDSGVADCTVQVDVTLNATAALAGPFIRGSGSTTTPDGICFWVSATDLLVQKFSVGTYTTLGSASGLGLTGGNTYTVKVVLLGNNHKVYIDGVLKANITATSGFETNTRHGIQVYGGSAGSNDKGSSFDNFLITT